ncbi:MAG: hypothetical protein WCO14_01580 [bacterium]
MSPLKTKKATPSHRLKKSKFNPGTVFLLVLLIVVASASLLIYMDPHALDPVNEFLYGPNLTFQPDPAVITRWTKTVTFNTAIDQSIRDRYLPIPTLTPPASEVGKVNPFVAVSP